MSSNLSQSDASPAACAGQAALVVILEEFFFGPFLVSAGFALLARASTAICDDTALMHTKKQQMEPCAGERWKNLIT